MSKAGKRSYIVLTDEEKEILEMLKTMPVEFVSEKLEIKVSSLYQRLYRLRKRIGQAQTLVNQTNNYRKNPHVEKLLTRSFRWTEPRKVKVPEKDDEDDL